MDMSGEWFKRRRLELEYKQADVSRLLELQGYSVTPGTISHWENGRYNIPLEDINARYAIASVLQLDVAKMLEEAGYGVIQQKLFGDAAQQAASIVDKLPPEAQKTALEQLRALERLVAGG
ncbi:MAG: helix-turn-helix transcriptional regulator [Anaerolineae bacterium]|nr:helix-turn-helix transcriptional regulator [Anaerolineae bacterium]